MKEFKGYVYFDDIEDIPIKKYIHWQRFILMDALVGSNEEAMVKHLHHKQVYKKAGKELDFIAHNQKVLKSFLEKGTDPLSFSFICLIGDNKDYSLAGLKAYKEAMLGTGITLEELQGMASTVSGDINSQLIANGFAKGYYNQDLGRFVSDEEHSTFIAMKNALQQAYKDFDTTKFFEIYASLLDIRDASREEQRQYKNMKESVHMLKKENYPVDTAYDYHMSMDLRKKSIPKQP